MITVTEYRTVTGDIITDTFERASLGTFSKDGTDTATGTRDMDSYGTRYQSTRQRLEVVKEQVIAAGQKAWKLLPVQKVQQPAIT